MTGLLRLVLSAKLRAIMLGVASLLRTGSSRLLRWSAASGCRALGVGFARVRDLATPRRVVALLLLGAVLAVALHAAQYYPFLSDDALISLRYADRLVDGKGLTWTDGARVEGYSDLLWVLLTASFHALGVDLIRAARALDFIGACAAVVLISLEPQSLRPSLARALSGGLGLALSAPLAIWAIGGLEHAFMVGVVVATLVGMGRYFATTTKASLGWTSLALCSLTLLRADGALLVLAMVSPTLLTSPHRFRRLVFWGVIPALTLGAQHAFRYVYYGAWVPNTAVAKVSFNAERWERGWQYVLDGYQPLWPFLVFTAALLALSARSLSWRRVAPALSLLMIWSGYLAAVGGDIFPGWRQLLLALPAVYWVAAEAAQALWQHSGQQRVVVGIAAVAAASSAYLTQTRDETNRLGKTERWEWAGYSVGPMLAQGFEGRQPLLAVDAAGALPYWTRFPSLDMLGLNDSYIAHHPPKNFGHGGIGHELGDGNYVLEQEPDIIAFNNASGSWSPLFLSGRQMLRTREFRRNYLPVRVLGWGEQRAYGELWLRRDGVVGFTGTERGVEIPGYFFSQGQAHATFEMDSGWYTEVNPRHVARLEGLFLERGSYRLTVSADGPAFVVSPMCAGQTMPLRHASAEELSFELSQAITVDFLIAPEPGATSTLRVQSAVLETLADGETARFCARRGRLRVPAKQLEQRVPAGSPWNHPQGVVFKSGLEVNFARPMQAPVLDISADNNDVYEVTFFLDEARLGGVALRPVSGPGGLALHRIQVPEKPRRRGFDRILIRAADGDGSYSIGHLIPLEH